MRIEVSDNSCLGYTICNMVAPELFDLREEDGHAVVRHPEVPEELHLLAEEAAASCPARAIGLRR